MSFVSIQTHNAHKCFPCTYRHYVDSWTVFQMDSHSFSMDSAPQNICFRGGIDTQYLHTHKRRINYTGFGNDGSSRNTFLRSIISMENMNEKMNIYASIPVFLDRIIEEGKYLSCIWWHLIKIKIKYGFEAMRYSRGIWKYCHVYYLNISLYASAFLEARYFHFFPQDLLFQSNKQH